MGKPLQANKANQGHEGLVNNLLYFGMRKDGT
jgi:hypothetical protein